VNSEQKKTMMDVRSAAWAVEDLEVFRRAYALSLDLHRGSLGFPRIEQFGGLADQLRRASRSVCALIVEGSGRQTSSPREFVRYLSMAIGSAEEARLWCRYAADLGYVDAAAAAEWRDEFGHILRMLQGLKRRLARAPSDH
jgi:four helix bundle protein